MHLIGIIGYITNNLLHIVRLLGFPGTSKFHRINIFIIFPLKIYFFRILGPSLYNNNFPFVSQSFNFCYFERFQLPKFGFRLPYLHVLCFVRWCFKTYCSLCIILQEIVSDMYQHQFQLQQILASDKYPLVYLNKNSQFKSKWRFDSFNFMPACNIFL